jgi:CRISPR-associated protein Cmr6
VTLPLPKRVAELIAQVKPDYHPGLALDKHLDPPAEVKDQKPALDWVCSADRDESLLSSLSNRRREALAGAVVWTAKSQGPLTLHLSRATALENAGIALHPLYGFAYLPGSGLKGLARAWSERVWLEAQAQREEAIGKIREIFGYAPRSEDGKSWIPASIAKDDSSSAGAVVFHDAWPCRWPTLVVDVAAVHHPDYYQAGEEKVPPPGDWEDPNPVCFLAVRSGTEFEFAVTPRRPEHAELAGETREWLAAALADWGAGAKTAAGYGRIVSARPPKPLASPQRDRFECRLELVTPAFLAGALQRAEDCDLRGATVRGQLRWWWRTMHAGHLEPRLLRRLETAIWGAASEGSAVQIALVPETNQDPQPFRGRDALGYLAYGMQTRNCKPAGSAWTLAITARRAEFRVTPKSDKPDAKISRDHVLEQASAALWLLTSYGGFGAKGRKGFGSLADINVQGLASIEDCKKLAAGLRNELPRARGEADRRAPSLERMRVPEPIPLRAQQPEAALAAVADAYRSFVKLRSMRDRIFLGLPRAKEIVDMGPPAGRVSRHPSLVHFHLARVGTGLLLKMANFDIERLVRGPEFFQEIEEALRKSLASNGPSSPTQPRGRRLPEPPSHGRRTERTTPDRRFVSGGYARLEGMRVTILEIRGNRAIVRFPNSNDPEEVDISDLDPYYPS